MALPTEQELAERRKQQAAVNSLSGRPQSMGQTQPDATNPTTGRALQETAGTPETVSASPSGALPTTGATPSPSGAAGGEAVSAQEGGGGVKPPQSKSTAGNVVADLAQENPDNLIEAAEKSASVVQRSVENADDNKGEMAKLAKGLNVSDKTIDQLTEQFMKGLSRNRQDGKVSDEHYTKLKDRWKNVFQYIGKDEMGLFLIDFGMRAMMAGESMGNLGAIGAAGSGALGALQGRRQAAVDQENALQGQARDMATETYGAETDRIRAKAAETQADASARSVDQRIASGGPRFKDEFLLDYYRSQGMTEDEIRTRMVGGKSYEETYDLVADDVEKAYLDALENAPIGDTEIGARPVVIGGKQMFWHELADPTLRAQLADEITQGRMDRRSKRGQGSLPPNDKKKADTEYLEEQR